MTKLRLSVKSDAAYRLSASSPKYQLSAIQAQLVYTGGEKYDGEYQVTPKFTEEISLSGWVCSVFANLTFILHTVLDKSNAFPHSQKTLSAAMKGSDYRSADCREISTRTQPGDFATTRGSNCYHLVAAILPSRGRNYTITRSPQTNPQRVIAAT